MVRAYTEIGCRPLGNICRDRGDNDEPVATTAQVPINKFAFGFRLEIVPQITQLEKLELNVRLDSRILVELCKLNPNLRRLTLRNSEIFGRLSGIVPHCNQLEYLSFVMKEVDASEYAALANLPQLKALILCGEHLEGSLVKLFSRFQEHQQIQSICIPETYVSNAEAIALASIGSVVSIRCCLRDKSFYSDLPLSGKLTNIYILGHPMQYNPDNPYYNEKEEDFLKVTYRAHRPLAVTRAYYQYWQTKDPNLLQLAFDEDYLHAHRLHCIGR
ncbi:GM24625 [Drosophila sechellia]|uniref:GM24625 n=1 Tax=Drosophila sechellia TaxID=7238 RepID=B4HG74_DROSE|nr:GM24625 [Drosophila sechellia]